MTDPADPCAALSRIFAGRRALLLEDNAEILNSLTRLVRSWGAEVIPSTGFNAQLIKEISLHGRIDGVLADHNLGPHSISGVESVFRIRELVGSPVPVVMLTGDTTTCAQAKASTSTVST